MRGAIIARDIVTRIIDSDTPDAPEDDKKLRKDHQKHVWYLALSTLASRPNSSQVS